MTERMDVYRPFYELGPEQLDGTDYCLQDKTIYCWSESNLGYEHCWWLTNDGWPTNDSDRVKKLLRDRPFDRNWLKEPRLKYGLGMFKITKPVEMLK